MNAKVMLLSAAVVLSLCACGTGSGPDTSSEVPTIQAAAAIVHHGTTLEVPKQYPTITLALAVATRGDLVRVASGHYPECLVLVDGVIVEGAPARCWTVAHAVRRPRP